MRLEADSTVAIWQYVARGVQRDPGRLRVRDNREPAWDAAVANSEANGEGD